MSRREVGMEVLAVRTWASWQDTGRVGVAHLGVPRAGAFDAPAAALANRLVGMAESSPVLEVLLGGLTVRFSRTVWVAVTGADVAVSVAGRAVAHCSAVLVPAGAALELGAARSGVRAHLAVRAELAMPAVFGSWSHDTLTGLGPAPLAVGQLWHLHRLSGAPVAVDTGLSGSGPSAQGARLRLLPGPQQDWFTDPRAPLRGDWQVSGDSDRIGVRLLGTPLTRAPGFVGREMESEPMVLGAVQVPPSGELVVFGPDHPVTGGYPVVGVVPPPDLARLAQLRPGESVSFTGRPPAPRS